MDVAIEWLIICVKTGVMESINFSRYFRGRLSGLIELAFLVADLSLLWTRSLETGVKKN